MDWESPLTSMRSLGSVRSMAIAAASLLLIGSAALLDDWSLRLEEIMSPIGTYALLVALLITVTQLVPALRVRRARSRFLRERCR
jgi:hypothetical protein